MSPLAFENADHAFGPLPQEWLDNMPYPDYEKIPVDDGYVFHLGGRDVEVLATPAHCKSSLSFIDHGRRLLFPGDELPAGATIGASKDFALGDVYIEDASIICKIYVVLPPFMSAFEVGTSFFNARSLTTNHYLTWGRNTLEHLKNYPVVTMRKV